MTLVSMTWPEYLAGVCRLNGHLRRLTFQEADMLLALLLKNPACWTSRNDLVAAVWENADGQPIDAINIVKKLIMKLRRHSVPIESCKGWGYRIPRQARGRPGELRMAA